MLSRADNAVVKLASGNYLFGGLVKVNAFVNDALNISGADAKGGLAAGVCGTDHSHTAGSHNNVYGVHKLSREVGGGLFDILNGVCRSTQSGNSFDYLIADNLVGLFGTGMGCDDNGIASLDCKHGVAHGGDDGIGAGGDGADDSHGTGDFGNAGVLVPIDYADGLFALKAVPDDAGFTLVFVYLVFIDAHAGLFDGKFGIVFGIVINRFSDFTNNGVHLLLGEILKLGGGNARLINHFAYHFIFLQ